MNILKEYYSRWANEYGKKNKTDESHIDEIAYAAFLEGFKVGETDISKRKIESYKRAELVCRELRYQIANNICDGEKLGNMVASWMSVTGKIKYERPK